MDDITRNVEQILTRLRDSRQTLSVAESLTGGLLGGAITSVAGASDVFVGGILAYSARLKSELLGVDLQQIQEFGVVSREVALAMATGAQAATKSDWAIATTGVAGPGPSEGVPPGRVWIAIVGPGALRGEYAQELNLPGERQQVRSATIARALEAFTRILSE